MAFLSQLTLADYRDHVKARMNIDRTLDNEIFTDADIDLYINTALIEFVRRVGDAENGFYRTRTVVDIEDGAITMPEDFLEQLQASYVDSTGNWIADLQIRSQPSMDKERPSWRVTPAVATPTALVVLSPTGVAGDSGIQALLDPQPSATVTNGLALSYLTKPPAMIAAADVAEPLRLFPELEPHALVAGALKTLYLNEAGEADDQAAKWEAVFERHCQTARTIFNRQYGIPHFYGNYR
jgi:hypothetical protein